MFTIDAIKAAHSKVKSGADFPAYVEEIKALGVKAYDHFLSDGHIEYSGSDGFRISAPAKWDERPIAPSAAEAQLRQSLKIHQQGGTDYMTFCTQAAALGIEKWTVDTDAMTCIYFDAQGNNILEEVIPEV